jgi:RNA-binding protein
MSEPSTASLSDRQRRWLKAQSHHLKPVVSVGQAGASEPLLAELEGALAHHELLKVKVAAGDRALRDAIIEHLLKATGATLVNRIGNVAVLYRANPRKRSPLALPQD